MHVNLGRWKDVRPKYLGMDGDDQVGVEMIFLGPAWR